MNAEFEKALEAFDEAFENLRKVSSEEQDVTIFFVISYPVKGSDNLQKRHVHVKCSAKQDELRGALLAVGKQSVEIATAIVGATEGLALNELSKMLNVDQHVDSH